MVIPGRTQPPVPPDLACKTCKGTGKVEHTDSRKIVAKMVCPECQGNGKKK